MYMRIYIMLAYIYIYIYIYTYICIHIHVLEERVYILIKGIYSLSSSFGSYPSDRYLA